MACLPCHIQTYRLTHTYTHKERMRQNTITITHHRPHRAYTTRTKLELLHDSSSYYNNHTLSSIPQGILVGLVRGVKVDCGLVGFDCVVILLHEEISQSKTRVSLYIFGTHSSCGFTISDSRFVLMQEALSCT